MGCQWLDVKLKRFFYKLGFWVGSNPWYFLTVPVLLTALCATGTEQEIYLQVEKSFPYNAFQTQICLNWT